MIAFFLIGAVRIEAYETATHCAFHYRNEPGAAPMQLRNNGAMRGLLPANAM
jgi:hypothetical protein